MHALQLYDTVAMQLLLSQSFGGGGTCTVYLIITRQIVLLFFVNVTHFHSYLYFFYLFKKKCLKDRSYMYILTYLHI